MRKLIVPILLMGITVTANAQRLSKNRANTGIKLISPGTYSLTVDFGGVSAKQGEGGWTKLDVNMDDLQYLNRKDEPAMPFMGYSFLVDDDNMEVSVQNAQYTDYTGFDIEPAKGKLSRKIDPSTIFPFAGLVYRENKFYPSEVATIVNDYVVHDAHGKTIWIFPVQYNPITHTLRVYTKVTVNVKAKVPHKPQDASGNRIWNGIYRRHFINYDLLGSAAAKATAAGDSVGYAAQMLIITPHSYADTLKHFIKWKNQLGICTYVTETDDIPGYPNQESIYAYVKQFYQEKHIDYLLLVGDHGAVTPRIDSGLVDNATLTFAGPSDISYGYLTGNDHYPDIFVGRLSASTLSDLAPQLTKTISYEKNPNVSGSWYTRAAGIASNQGPGDDNEMDWEHMRNIRTQLMAADYTDVAEMYDSTHGIVDAPGDPLAIDATNAIDSGISLLNYCGHGWDEGIVTTGLSNSDIPYLTNSNGAWPFVLIVGCDVGSFVGTTCFAEVFQRAKDADGNPIGSVANFMSTISQYWSEPMEAQDEINAILSNNSPDTLDNVGPIVEAGCMAMNNAYNQAGYDMTDTWVIFGDPSLQIRKKVPATLTVTHPTTITTNTTFVNTTVNNNGATVTLMHYDTLFSVRPVISNGTHHGFSSLQAGDSIMVSATAPNTKPYFGKIMVIAPTDVVNTNTGENTISLYPNPSKNRVYVKGIWANTSYTITDMAGKKAITGFVDNNAAIDISKLAAGSYIVELLIGNKASSLPLQILK